MSDEGGDKKRKASPNDSAENPKTIHKVQFTCCTACGGEHLRLVCPFLLKLGEEQVYEANKGNLGSIWSENILSGNEECVQAAVQVPLVILCNGCPTCDKSNVICMACGSIKRSDSGIIQHDHDMEAGDASGVETAASGKGHALQWKDCDCAVCEKGICWNCGKIGHIRHFCQSRLPVSSGKQQAADAEPTQKSSNE